MSFRSAIINEKPENLLTFRELYIYLLKTYITAIHDWRDKINDTSITDHYYEEFLVHKKMESNETMKNIFTYALQDLKNQSDQDIIYLYKGILISDENVDPNVRSQLEIEIEKLKNSQPIDYHPNSDNKVINIIHPSLNCYVHGITKIKNTSLFPEPTTPNHSKKFQWLPTDVHVDRNYQCKFLSYVNNLDPKSPLNSLLEDLLSYFIPMFEFSLGFLQKGSHKIDDIPHYQQSYDSIEKSFLKKYFTPEQLNEIKGESITRDELENIVYNNMNDDNDYELEDLLNNKNIKITLPTFMKKFKSTKLPRYSLKNKQLQIIIKIGEIFLRPNENYPGGNWHVEGMINERIVATGIYYYDIDNIENSRLSFRQSVDEQEIIMEYPQDRSKVAEYIYGFKNEKNFAQPLPNIKALNDRLLVFPNIYQHKIESFGLENKTQSGTRKTIVFFLVDPDTEIISTSMIPQQNLSNAKDIRLELMSERKSYEKTVNDEFVRNFFLCEH